nr:variant surface glycoprotein 1125.1411 [Trypanosoma brucei]
MMIAFLLILARRSHGDSKAGENAGAFTALCAAIKVAKATPADLQEPPEINSIMQTIAAINLTVADDAFNQKIDKSKTWATVDDKFRQKRAGWDKHYDMYASSKAEITGEGEKKYAKWSRHRSGSAVAEQVRFLANEAFAINLAVKEERRKLATAPVSAKLNEALYGTAAQDDNTYKIGISGSNGARQNVCSQTSNAHARKKGFSLVRDALCLCTTGGGGDTSTGKACCEKCAKAPDAELNTNTDGTAWWKPLEAACTGMSHPPDLNRQTLQAAITGIQAALKHKTTTQTTSNNVLGTLLGTGSAGLTGNSVGGSNAGKCVIYIYGLTVSGNNKVAWLEHLQQTGTEPGEHTTRSKDETRRR